MQKTKILLVRHGQTVDNANQILQGQTQGRLTDEGIRQAELLSQELADETIDVFISSDLNRAVATCKIIAAPHNKPVVTTPLLRERDWGDFTGRFIPDIKDEVWPDNVEKLESIMDRVREFIDKVRSDYAGMTMLVVGHGIVNKALQALVFGKRMCDIEKMNNAEMRVVFV